MNQRVSKIGRKAIILFAMVLALMPVAAGAKIDGVTGTTFNLTAKDGYIVTGGALVGSADSGRMYMWGYALGSGAMQYPGPTLILNQGDTIIVNLTNSLTVPVSIVFPGQTVTAGGGIPGLITQEAPPGGIVSYTFVASRPGTYIYQSGTRPELQVEMGLLGAIIVRPTIGPSCPALAADPARPTRGYAYCTTDAYYDREYLFLTTEIDPDIHNLVEFGNLVQVDNSKRHSTAWFFNGRAFPDTMADPNAAWLPTQPYNTMPLMHPGEKVLARLIGGGRDLHPFHTHGQNHLVIARDGNLLKTAAGTSVDLSVSDYTTTSVPGETADLIWGPWTGAKLGWDVYGDPTVYPHTCTPDLTGFDPVTFEWCADHGKPLPVQLPAPSLLFFGPMYGGTPFLGISGDLPTLNPDGTVHSQQNPLGGISFMWHSHSERELTSNNIFIGGMATMALVVPFSVPIP
jgi:FtsP/CotA-like multicopper oxidase with cupredoxin domain